VRHSLQAPYESTYRQLPVEQARAFRLVAIPNGPDISVAAAAAVLELPPAEAEYLLEALADVHLVEPGSRGRYRYLNPVRTFARNQAMLDDGETEFEGALGRLAGFYLASMRNALRIVNPHATVPEIGPPAAGGLTFPTAQAARSWLLFEHDHIRAATVQAADVPGAPVDELACLVDLEPQAASA
jgi:hypothetical protein